MGFERICGSFVFAYSVVFFLFSLYSIEFAWCMGTWHGMVVNEISGEDSINLIYINMHGWCTLYGTMNADDATLHPASIGMTSNSTWTENMICFYFIHFSWRLCTRCSVHCCSIARPRVHNIWPISVWFPVSKRFVCCRVREKSMCSSDNTRKSLRCVPFYASHDFGKLYVILDCNRMPYSLFDASQTEKPELFWFQIFVSLLLQHIILAANSITLRNNREAKTCQNKWAGKISHEYRWLIHEIWFILVHTQKQKKKMSASPSLEI